MLSFDCHEMNARDTLHALEFLDLLQSNLDSFFGNLIFRNALESLDDLIVNIHARNFVFHVVRHADILHGG